MTAPSLTLDGFHPEFADFAEAMADDRTRAYPARVAARAMAQADADHGIFVMRAIADIWRSAADGLTPRRDHQRLTREEAVATLDKAIATIERRLVRQPDNPLFALQHDRLRAMRWWHARFPERAYVLNMALLLRYEAIQRAAQPDSARAAA